MSLFREIAAAVLMVGGAGIVAIAALGVARLPDAFMRMHAATKAGVVGAGLVLLGVGLAFGTAGPLLTALFGVAFLLATTPIASHVIGRAAYVAGAPIADITVADALQGVVSRKVFDIDPSRTRRRPRAAASPSQERAMQAVPLRELPAGTPAAAGAPLRVVTCWLVGGTAQRAAVEVAADLAAASRATLVGFSAVNLDEASPGGPLPVGGGFWSRWHADRQRAAMRTAAADACRTFAQLTEGPAFEVVSIHKEADLETLGRASVGSDLAIVPAGVAFGGHGAGQDGEVAAALFAARPGPILRVRQRPAAVRNVLILVGTTAGCGRLAHGLLRAGLWPDAAVTILPVGDDRRGVVDLVEGQAGLLRAHGRRVTVMPSIDLDFERDHLVAQIRGFDAAVLGCLTGRIGWIGAMRNCPHQVVSDTVPVALLP